MTKKKGLLILSISEAIFSKLGFKDELETRENEVKMKIVSKPFIALPNNKHSARSRMYILEKI